MRFVSCSANAPPMPIPAEFTSTSMPPCRSACAATDARALLGSARFAGDRGALELAGRGLELAPAGARRA